jgi:hypothetical protein
MTSIKYFKNNYAGILFVLLILFFAFLYYIYYVTPSRVTWYDEMHYQTDNLITQVRYLLGIK